MTPKLPLSIQKAINRYESVEMDGLTFYPIRVDEYEAFLMARPGIEVIQGSLPLEMISMPLLSALYKMDYDAVMEGYTPAGFFSRCLLFLALSLRLGEGWEIERRLKMFAIDVSPQDPSKLVRIRFKVNGDEIYTISPVQFARYRPILAAQNGIKLLPDDANPELVRSRQALAAKNAPDLDVTIDDVISGVAALTGADEVDIYDWPILKLERRKTALQRVVDFIVCGISEGSGCKWKDGNPVPSMWYEKERKDTTLIDMNEFTKGQSVTLQAGGTPGLVPNFNQFNNA